jgi:hypothetical protein
MASVPREGEDGIACTAEKERMAERRDAAGVGAGTTTGITHRRARLNPRDGAAREGAR